MNDIQKACVESLKGREREAGDDFKMGRATDALPEAPKAPEGAKPVENPTAHIPKINRPTHPWGKDYDDLIELAGKVCHESQLKDELIQMRDAHISALVQDARVRTEKIEGLEKALNVKMKIDDGINRLRFDNAFEAYFGQTQSKAKKFIAERLGL